MFTEKERAYLGSQRLDRLATVSPSGQPDADVVGFELDGDDILIGSYQNLAGSRKYKNVAAGACMISLIVDSLASVDPMDPVAVKIHGTDSIDHLNGRFGPMEYIVIRPQTVWSWGWRDQPSSRKCFSRTNRSPPDPLVVAPTLEDRGRARTARWN